MHYRSIWKTFGTSNEEELCFVHECTTSGYRSCENGFAYPIRSQTMFESILEHLEDLRHVKRGRTCVSCINALHQGTKVVKMVSPTPLDPKRWLRVFRSIWKTFGTSNEEDLWHVKRGRTCISCMNALHQGTEVVKMVSPTPLDPKGYLGVFRSIRKTFGTSN